MDKVKYKQLKSKADDFFCIDNLRAIYGDEKHKILISFVDFLMCIEDFYTFVYSHKVSRTAWMLFTWLKTLVRYDGCVKLSYKDIISRFGDGTVLSKPTFFKYISELESYGLIKRIMNKKLFNTEYQNDSNTYMVISKVNEILPLLHGIGNREEFYEVLSSNFGLKVVANEKANKNKSQKGNNKKYTYEYVMNEEYVDVKTEIEDFFLFLGSANKSGKIAKSRKEKFLNIIMDIYPCNDDLNYAISQTISKGVKNEKYLYAILKNLYNLDSDEDGEENDTEKELKAKYKIKTAFKGNSGKIDEDMYHQLAGMIVSKRSGYKTVFKKLKEYGIIKYGAGNQYEQRLVDACKKLKAKEMLLKKASCVRGDRMALLDEYDIHEYVGFSSTFNESIYWYYGNDETNIVPLDVIKKIADDVPEMFELNSVQNINYEVYKDE